MGLALETDWSDGGHIPAAYTCGGAGTSPAVSWQGSDATRSFVLTLRDPDAPHGTFTHWLVYNIPSSVHHLPEGIPSEGQLENGAMQGLNDFHHLGYGAPCPPEGQTHRYVLTVYALDSRFDLGPGQSINAVMGAMEGHLLEQGQLTGLYTR